MYRSFSKSWRRYILLGSYSHATKENLLKKVRMLPLVIFCTVLLFIFKMAIFFPKIKEPFIFINNTYAAAVDQKESQNITSPQTTSSTDKIASPQDPQKSVPFTDFDPLKMSAEDFKVLQSLSAREKQKQAHSPSVVQMSTHEAIKSQIEKKIQELTTLKKSLQELVDKTKEQENSNIPRLIKVCENMKPKEAAAILEGVEFNILVEIMEKIKETKASAILANMTPEKASYLMTEIALRKRIFKKRDIK